MDYCQSVEAEYLRANRSTFVNPEFWFSLDGSPDAAPKSTSWFVDVLAVNFQKRCDFLCELTYSKAPYALLKRLGTWAENWPSVTAAIRRDANIPGDWNIIPWVFVPEARIAAIRDRLPRFPAMPPITALEDTLPWKFCNWDRRAGGSYGGIRRRVLIGGADRHTADADFVLQWLEPAWERQMVIPLDEERYQQIRAAVLRRRLERFVEEAERSGAMTFRTAEECMAHLNTLAPPEDRPADSGKKIR